MLYHISRVFQAENAKNSESNVKKILKLLNSLDQQSPAYVIAAFLLADFP